MEERKEIITLVDEDGSKLEFLALDYFDVDEVEYAVLLPLKQYHQLNVRKYHLPS